MRFFGWKNTGLLCLMIMLAAGLMLAAGCEAEPEEVVDEPVEEPVDDEPVDPDEPQYGGTLVYGMSMDITGLEPGVRSWENHEIIRHIVEGLLTVDEDLEVIPALARDYDVSEDGTVYTFYLHEGVLFHNGEEMTADDVVYSIEYFLDAPRGGELGDLENIEKIDEYTVEITIEEPSGPFLTTIASPYTVAIMPEGIVEEQDGEISHLIGTGPFELVEWVPDRHTRMARFEDYWGGYGEPSGLGGEKTAYVDELVIQPSPEIATRMVGLETGEIDIAFIPGKEVDRLAEQPFLEVTDTGPSLEFWNYWFNVDEHPFDDINFRKAFAHALNREEILIAAADGHGEISNSPFPPGSFWRTAEHDIEYEHDMDKAMEYLEASDYDGEPVEIISYVGYTGMDRMGVIAETVLREMGVNAELNNVEAAAMWDMFEAGEYQIMTYGYGAMLDPHEFYYGRVHSNMNTNNWQNDEYDELVEQAQRETDPEIRRELYGQAQEIIMEELPLLCTYHEQFFNVYHENVRGYEAWPAVFWRGWNVWLDE